jgi:hypothetical protein
MSICVGRHGQLLRRLTAVAFMVSEDVMAGAQICFFREALARSAI